MKRFKFYTTLVSCFCVTSAAYSVVNTKKDLERIVFDVDSMQVFTSGIYQAVEGKNPLAGLQAETMARRDGVDFFGKYVKDSCSGIEGISEKQGWQQSFRSQGSTIYPEGTLEISLKAPFRDVFQLSSSASEISHEGARVVFIFPHSLPGEAMRCGAFVLEMAPGKNAYIVPKTQVSAPLSAENDSKNKYVKLVFDDKKAVLRPENPKDVEGLSFGSLSAVSGVMYTTQK